MQGRTLAQLLPSSSVLYGTFLEHDRFDISSDKGSYLLFKHSSISKAAEMQLLPFPAAWSHAVERKTRVIAWKKGSTGNHWASRTRPLVYEKEIKRYLVLISVLSLPYTLCLNNHKERINNPGIGNKGSKTKLLQLPIFQTKARHPLLLFEEEG